MAHDIAMAPCASIQFVVLATALTLSFSANSDASIDQLQGAKCTSLLQLQSSPGRHLSFKLGPRNEKQQKVVDMMRHAWKGYTKHCWGKDELLPVDGECSNNWNMGLTLIDSLDTLYLMGLRKEFNAARSWVANRTALNFNNVGTVSLFETTIRVLGGLLGAHALSGDKLFLERAGELGDRMLPAFKGKNHRGSPPTTDVDLHLKKGVSMRDPYIAESGTLGLEFKTLSQLTGNSKYAKAVEAVGNAMHKESKFHGLVHNSIDAWDGNTYGPFKLGAGGDSYYEYLLKQWLLTGRKDRNDLHDYINAMQGIKHYLVKSTSGPLQLTYVAERFGKQIDRKMDHLVCFLPGTLALGAHNGVDADGWHLQLAKQLMRTCYEMYNATGKMLGPEIALFDTDGQEMVIRESDNFDLLRPETVESLFYLYRLTGDQKYQDWGWQITQAIERYAKVKGGGYTSLDGVSWKHPQERNHMESFFSAETLKYLFLLFDDSRTQVPLEKYVFNTEAHPLQVISQQEW